MDDLKDLSFTKFAVGQPVSRFEDPILLKGEGTYTDDYKADVEFNNAYVFRSPYAHATILSLDVDEAKKATWCC